MRKIFASSKVQTRTQIARDDLHTNINNSNANAMANIPLRAEEDYDGALANKAFFIPSAQRVDPARGPTVSMAGCFISACTLNGSIN